MTAICHRYYEGGASSAYFWDVDDGFAGVILLKKCTSIPPSSSYSPHALLPRTTTQPQQLTPAYSSLTQHTHVRLLGQHPRLRSPRSRPSLPLQTHLHRNPATRHLLHPLDIHIHIQLSLSLSLRHRPRPRHPRPIRQPNPAMLLRPPGNLRHRPRREHRQASRGHGRQDAESATGSVFRQGAGRGRGFEEFGEFERGREGAGGASERGGCYQ